MFCVVCFFAVINFGFKSSNYTQLNKSIWIDACFDYLQQSSDVSLFKNKSDLGNLSNGNDNLTLSAARYFVSSADSIEEKKEDEIDFKSDSMKIVDSLLAAMDTIKVDSMALDSTARLEYFRYQRSDDPVVNLKKKRGYSFFVEPSDNQKVRTIKIDSTGRFVEISEKVGGQKTKILLRLPIEEYIQLRLALKEREIWEGIGYSYELKSQVKGLGDLIRDITDFEIPLPSVGLLSIFGTPKISLKIGGAVDIHGAWRSETTEGVTASRLGNTRNEPDFKQQVQINVNGTIGDKLNISADWNTERTFEYENQLKLKYTGYEDEIIQSIEAGNVSLQTSPLVGGSEALFGIKANFKMGPLTLTTIASQKKGEVKEVSVSGGSTSSEFAIRVTEYSKNHYFLDPIYSDTSNGRNYFNRYYGNPTPSIDASVRIVDIEVWKSTTTSVINKSNERNANAFIDLPPLAPGQLRYDSIPYRTELENPIPGAQETARFILLGRDIDYKLHEETGYITFLTQIQDQDIIAVAYRTASQRFGEFINTAVSDSQKLVLKLIKPKNLLPQYTTAWSLQLKNIYPLNARNLKREGFEFFIKYEVEGQEPVTNLATGNGTVPLLNAFGLDLVDASNQANPDNIFDWRPDLTIIPITGEVIFPTLQPFGRNLPGSLDPALRYLAVYDTIQAIARQNKSKDKWVLAGKSSGDASSVYQLGFNIVENSVRVRLNGRELSPGSDYSVDYNTGQLTLRNSDATLPGADLKITFEQNDLFQLASKTLLGARGIFDFSKKTKLGFSILNLNQQTLSDKVRIGEEPLSNTIYGLDFETRADLPFITKGLDNIISTREMSDFSIKGEYAYINPDPNTKKSTIASDNGKSIAYIDDFEGAKRIIPVGVSYTSWRDLSPPGSLTFLPGLSPLELMGYKAKSFWFTETPSNVVVSDLYGDRKKVSTADQQITVMDYVFIPDTPGTYNYSPLLSTRRDSSWGGIMKPLSSTASNLIEENIEFIEFWLQINSAPADAKLFIDLGRISEDVIPNNRLDKEDKDDNGAITDEAEDTGIDGILDGDERGRNNSTKGDPSGDNFFFQRGSSANPLFDYFSINGTQGNAILTDLGRIPDTEDLNRNSTLDVVNSYFRYAVPLDTVAENNPYIVGGGERIPNQPSWYLYRIPLKDTLLNFGNPDLSNVETIRLFLRGVSSTVHLRLTEFNLVGSQWQKLLPNDTVLSVSVINREDNPDYTSPPGVNPERDRSKPDEEVYGNEQSLNLILTDLQQGDKREAVKYLFRPLDVFNYSEMKLFIHGDTNGNSISDTSNGNFRAQVYFRFGGDTNNYYEYRQPVAPGWNEINILFSELTAIKQARDSINKVTSIPVSGLPGHFYQILGSPSLTSVKFLTVGIVNISDESNPGPISGEVWVNELRVIGADDTPGFAYSFSTAFKLADLMSVSFNMSQTSPYFHRLADRFGSRIETRNWSVNTDLNVLKLLPINLPESNLRINYSHTESIGKPLYIPGTDIKVDAAAEQLRNLQSDSLRSSKSPENLISETQTINISDTWSASNIKLKIPSTYWLIRDTWNAVTFGFNYNKAFSRNPTTESSKSWVWNATVNYGLSLSPTYNIEPALIPVIGTPVALLSDYSALKIYYLPQSFSLSVNAKRNRNSNTTRATLVGGSQNTVSRDFTTSRAFNFVWKLTEGGFLNLTTNYNLTVNSTLAYLETDSRGKQRNESDIWKDIFTRVFFGQDYQYQQSLEFRTSPKLPTLWDLNKFFSITTGYSASYQWNFDTRQLDLGRSAGFSNRSNLGLTLRLKSLSAPLFVESESNPENIPPPKTQTQTTTRRGRDRITDPNQNELKGADSLLFADSLNLESDTQIAADTLQADTTPKISPITNALKFLKTFARVVFFDYETISINFTNDNSLSKSGVLGKGTGFSNFWGVSYNEDNGPSRGFMVGLSGDVGRRAPNANLTDAYQQKNNLDFRTSRPLWEGAKIDLTWKVGWSMNKSTTLTSDDDGNTTVNFITASGTINRSFLSLPPSLFLSVFNSGIKRVNELYDPEAPNSSENLSNAFIQGFESLPLLSKIGFLGEVANYIPRPNWRITWDGLEKVFIFKSIAKRVSLDHSYSSSYTEGWKINPEGAQEVQTQKIEYGFTPLLGLNITFGELWGGNLTSNIKYSARTNYDLGITTKNITETFSRDIGITAGYSKSGFELPLFGVSLKNDIEFSLSYTSTKNSTVRFEMANFSEEGTPQDGTIRTTIEPRIKYTISSKVTISIFYKRSSVEPEGAARIPPTTTNEAGLDVHIAINN